jgi:GDP-L-fucose synthase
MQQDSRIYVAGARGLVGGAILRHLQAAGYGQLLAPSRRELDLMDRMAVERFFAEHRPEYVFLAAARVGGIQANSRYPAEFLYENLTIQNNVIDVAFRSGVKKLAFLGSSCIYPRLAPQPIREESLLRGSLEPTNEGYAIAKIAGLKLCQAYVRQYGWNAICLMPTNLYGPGDNFSETDSHVLPGLIRRFDEAKRTGAPSVMIWGTGTPRREFLHVDDLAAAAVYLMERYDSPEPLNVGTGEDLSIAELAAAIRETVGYEGDIVYDPSKPDGTPRKLLDVHRVHALGWRHRISLAEGLKQTYAWYLENRERVRR